MSSKLGCCGDPNAVNNNNNNRPRESPDEYIRIINLINDLKNDFNIQINEIKNLIEINRCQCQHGNLLENQSEKQQQNQEEIIKELKDMIIAGSCKCHNINESIS